MSLAKITAIIYAILFEILVVFFMIPPTLSGIGNTELFRIAGVILLAPVIYGLIGFVTGAFIALVFNFVCKFINSLELEV